MMLIPKKQMTAVSVSAFLILGLSGCSSFISLKETSPPVTFAPLPSPNAPAATTAPESVVPEVPQELEIPTEAITAIPIPPEDIEAPEPVEEAPPEFSQPVETVPAAPPVSEEYAEVTTNDENTVRLRAGDTLDRIVEISTSPSYQKLAREAEAVGPTDHEPGSPKLRAVIAANRTAMEEIHRVFTFSDTGLVQVGAVSADASREGKDSMRDVVVLNRFVLITRQLRDKTGVMEVSPGGIFQRNSDWYFKSNYTLPKTNVILRGTKGSDDYHYIRGFEGFNLDSGGIRFAMEG